MKFTPHPDYNMLRKQAYAMNHLINSLENRVELYQRELQEMQTRCKLQDNSELEAERETNKRLTEIIVGLESRIEWLDKRLQEDMEDTL